MSTPRDETLDGMKGVLILLVTWGHSIQYLGYASMGELVAKYAWVDPVFKAIYLFHMPLFMVLSGFLCEQALGREAGMRRIGRSVLRLGVPVFLWYLLFKLAHYLVLNGWTGFGSYASVSLWTHACFELSLMAWFAWLVLGFGVLMLVLRRLKCDHLWGWGTLWLASLWLQEGGLVAFAQFCLPFFGMGYAYAKRSERIAPRWRNWMSWACLPLFMAACLVYGAWNPRCFVYLCSWNVHTLAWNELLFRFGGIGVCTLSAFVVFLALRSVMGTAWFRGWGRESLLIYVLQILFFESVKTLPFALSGTRWFGVIVAPLFAVLLCTALLWLVQAFRQVPGLGPLLVGPSSLPERTSL